MSAERVVLLSQIHVLLREQRNGKEVLREIPLTDALRQRGCSDSMCAYDGQRLNLQEVSITIPEPQEQSTNGKVHAPAEALQTAEKAVRA